jgi:hypothetical protein
VIPKSDLWQAVRRHCLECVGSYEEIKQCGGDDLRDGTSCPLHPYRLAKSIRVVGDDGKLPNRYRKTKLFSAIRQTCIQCVGTVNDICSSPRCNLYPFRLGRTRAVAEHRESILKAS